MPSITTQNQAKLARSRLSTLRGRQGQRGLCYLCGEGFTGGSSDPIQTEHVIPRSVLGTPPKAANQRFSLTLKCHRACDQSRKEANDRVLHALEAMEARPAGASSVADLLRGRVLRPFVTLPSLPLEPTIIAARPLMDGIWTWIRGLHAALYGEYLPETVGHREIAPVPEGAHERADATVRKTQSSLRSIAARIVLEGVATAKRDEVSIWGNEFRYCCTWVRLPDEQRGCTRGWTCFWILRTPRLREWTLNACGEPIPWTGMYSCPVPSLATCLDVPGEYSFDTKSLPTLISRLLAWERADGEPIDDPRAFR